MKLSRIGRVSLAFVVSVAMGLGMTALVAVQQETQTIPIIVVGLSDAVDRGFVASLAHPGGNITGFTDWDSTMGSKFLELLKEIAPGVATHSCGHF